MVKKFKNVFIFKKEEFWDFKNWSSALGLIKSKLIKYGHNFK